MSSHHIVREKQEPALYIHQLGDFDLEHLGQLLEWSPTVLVNESEYEKMDSLGIKIDVLLANEVDFYLQEHLKIIPSLDHPLTSALNYLIENNYPAVNIITQNANNLSIDEYTNKINLLILDSHSKRYSIQSGYSVWKPQGTQFEITEIEKLTTSNLKQISTHLFEVEKDGLVQFNFPTKQLFITEKL